jgi:hypothetical protein
MAQAAHHIQSIDLPAVSVPIHELLLIDRHMAWNRSQLITHIVITDESSEAFSKNGISLPTT